MKSLDIEKLKLIKIRIILTSYKNEIIRYRKIKIDKNKNNKKYKEFQFQKDIRTAVLPDTSQDVIVTVPP